MIDYFLIYLSWLFLKKIYGSATEHNIISQTNNFALRLRGKFFHPSLSFLTFPHPARWRKVLPPITFLPHISLLFLRSHLNICNYYRFPIRIVQSHQFYNQGVLNLGEGSIDLDQKKIGLYETWKIPTPYEANLKPSM